ncbi:MAG: hypothetical protein JWM83_3273 [Candidatus Angelobacter sp.]|nr:hypothetical protein [Candidatus Angelobacter sp.]
MPNQPLKSKKHVISTQDPFGNPVHMTEQTWNCKKERHPEIVPFFPTEIEQTVMKPEGYRHSTADYAKNDTIAFERKVGVTNVTLRVFVQYESTTFTKGGTTGKITTIYPPSASYKKAQLGPFIPFTPDDPEEEKA